MLPPLLLLPPYYLQRAPDELLFHYSSYRLSDYVLYYYSSSPLQMECSLLVCRYPMVLSYVEGAAVAAAADGDVVDDRCFDVGSF